MEREEEPQVPRPGQVEDGSCLGSQPQRDEAGGWTSAQQHHRMTQKLASQKNEVWVLPREGLVLK